MNLITKDSGLVNTSINGAASENYAEVGR